MLHSAPRPSPYRWLCLCLDGLLPRHCVLCGQRSGSGNLCTPCRADLPRPGRVCRRCALPAPYAGDLPCGRCLQRPPPWDRAVAALAYVDPADWLVCRFKFGRDFSCGQVLGLELLDAISRSDHPPPDLIAPVPLHRARHFSRTFNQADLLARFLGREMGIPVHSRLLVRNRTTRAQSGLSAAGRRRNIRGAFHCGCELVPANAHVALVDDVMTTGATLTECTKTLRKDGVARVSVWVTARAPTRDGMQ